MENTEKRHSITIEGRNKGLLSGVNKVVSASPEEIYLLTGRGGLLIKGKELKISSFSEESGALSFDGTVDKIEYDKIKQSFFKRIFK